MNIASPLLRGALERKMMRACGRCRRNATHRFLMEASRQHADGIPPHTLVGMLSRKLACHAQKVWVYTRWALTMSGRRFSIYDESYNAVAARASMMMMICRYDILFMSHIFYGFYGDIDAAFGTMPEEDYGITGGIHYFGLIDIAMPTHAFLCVPACHRYAMPRQPQRRARRRCRAGASLHWPSARALKYAGQPRRQAASTCFTSRLASDGTLRAIKIASRAYCHGVKSTFSPHGLYRQYSLNTIFAI